MSNERILVTGGAGFIGAHLCHKLLDKGIKVICLDNLYTGRIENIKDMMDNPSFEFVEQDVTQPMHYDVKQIYNLACPASPVHYQYNPIKTMQTSVLGAMNVLELAREVKARVLQASTSEVYGDPLQHPQTEAYWGHVNPIGIRSCYDEGKRCAETLFWDYHRYYGVDTKVARIFNTYGPHMHPLDGRVVSNFIMQALQGKDITIYGDGTQTRSFCYVDDLVNGLMAMMDLEEEFTGPVNLGNPCEFSILELADIVLVLTNSKSKLCFKDLPEDDPKQRCPDITLAKNKLCWEPQVSLREGLQKTISYYFGISAHSCRTYEN